MNSSKETCDTDSIKLPKAILNDVSKTCDESSLHTAGSNSDDLSNDIINPTNSIEAVRVDSGENGQTKDEDKQLKDFTENEFGLDGNCDSKKILKTATKDILERDTEREVESQKKLQPEMNLHVANEQIDKDLPDGNDIILKESSTKVETNQGEDTPESSRIQFNRNPDELIKIQQQKEILLSKKTETKTSGHIMVENIIKEENYPTDFLNEEPEYYEDQPKEISDKQHECSKEQLEHITEEKSEHITEEQAERITEEPSERITEEPSECITEEQSEHITEEQSEHITEEQSEHITEEQSEHITEEQFEHVIEDQSESYEEQPDLYDEQPMEITEEQSEKDAIQIEETSEEQPECADDQEVFPDGETACEEKEALNNVSLEEGLVPDNKIKPKDVSILKHHKQGLHEEIINDNLDKDETIELDKTLNEENGNCEASVHVCRDEKFTEKKAQGYGFSKEGAIMVSNNEQIEEGFPEFQNVQIDNGHVGVKNPELVECESLLGLGESHKDAHVNKELPKKYDAQLDENIELKAVLTSDIPMFSENSITPNINDQTKNVMHEDENIKKQNEIKSYETLDTKNVVEQICVSKNEALLKDDSSEILSNKMNIELERNCGTVMEDNNVLEGSTQPDDCVVADDGQSIITGLVDYPSDSEDLSVKHIVPELELTKSQTLVHTPCFEEDAQSSWSIDTSKVTPVKIKQLATTVDEDSRASSISQKSACKRPHSDDEALQVFTAEQMFEYRWPADGGEFYLVQEHVSEFLGVKSFKRKYPDCTRRPAEVAEKRYLKDKGVVSETQCDLGLTAIRTDDVLELMSKDYPEKYQEYIRVLQERERQKINSKHKEYSTPSIDKNKMNDFIQKAIKSTAEFNMHLNQERREERRTSFDMQTFTIHVPANKIMKLNKEATKVGKYPVALLPGQFQDYYRPYTSQELKYFPINTVLYGPLKELPTVYTQPNSDGSQSDSDDSCASEGSCCSSSQGTHDSGDSSSASESAPRFKTESLDHQIPTLRIKDRLTSTCKVCHGTHERNKEGYSEDLIHCSECGSSGHPSCLDITTEMFETIRTYAWQCMDCKTCMLCMDPYDEDKMMFCDRCDRGYHTFCVGLKNLPNGPWICRRCGQCTGCGARAPGPEGSKAQWQQDSSKNATDKKPQLLCLACAKPSKR